jgi:ketosteroid isomerase-like protein
MKKLLIFLVAFTSVHSFSQTKDEIAIRKVMNDQVIAWNNGNVEEFMKGYWNNDSVIFMGKEGPNYGYTTTLKNYKKGYPDTVAMGKLSFTFDLMKKLSADYYFIVGKFYLKRSIGDAKGVFTLLLRKINGEWKIVVDHTS